LGKSLIFILFFALICWVAFLIIFVVIADMILCSNNTVRLLGQKGGKCDSGGNKPGRRLHPRPAKFVGRVFVKFVT
jgi:hypothetical protein